MFENPTLEATFDEHGYCGPFDLLSPAECALLDRHLDDPGRPKPLAWSKGLAARDIVIYQLATRPLLLSRLDRLLGRDYMLWGASVVDREAGQEHPWHTDIESSSAKGRFVTAWVGLANTSAESALKLIAGSHLIGCSLQQAAAEHQVAREARTAEAALKMALEVNASARLVEPAMRDGQVLLFDGRTWHGSHNTSRTRRRALVLQFATSDSPVRIPDFHQLDWPFIMKPSPLPPVLAVRGKGKRRINRLVPPPEWSPSTGPLRPTVRPVPWPLPRDEAKGWRPTPLYSGSTPVLTHLGCHASVLEPGQTPHPPHAHLDEELLFVLKGEADVVIASSSDDKSPRVERLKPGDFAYYPAFQFHTLRCPGPEPVSYLMYRWNSSLLDQAQPTTTFIYRQPAAIGEARKGRFSTEVVFEGPTSFLDKIHVHRSLLGEGGGYPAHVDAHDVALLLLSGQFKTLGEVVDAPAVVICPAGTLHGMRGGAAGGATYLVVEFHGQHRPPSPRQAQIKTAVSLHLKRVENFLRRKLRR